MPTQACIQNGVQQLDNRGHQRTNWKQQIAKCWFQNEQCKTMDMWVVTQCVERIEKQKNNDLERLGENKVYKSWEQWFSTCYHGSKHNLWGNMCVFGTIQVVDITNFAWWLFKCGEGCVASFDVVNHIFNL